MLYDVFTRYRHVKLGTNGRKSEIASGQHF